MTDEQKTKLLRSCELLIDQYSAAGDFTMGGYLTNAPFLQIGDVLKELGIEPKSRVLYEVKASNETAVAYVMATTAERAKELSGKDADNVTAAMIF